MKWIFTLLLTMLLSADMSAKELTEKSKKEYSEDKTLREICYSPEDASKKQISKHKLSILYQGQTLKIPKAYQKIFIHDTVVVKKSVEEGENVPLVYPKNDKYLGEKFKEALPDTTITIYGTLRHKISKKIAYYYFIIEDIEIPLPETENVTKSEEESGQKFDPKEYQQITPRQLKVNFTEYLDKKVVLPLNIKNIINAIPNQYQKLTGMDLEHYAMIDAVELTGIDAIEPSGIDVEHLGISVLFKRTNKAVSEKLINTTVSDDMLFYGRLRKTQDPTSEKIRPIYYFFLDALEQNKDNKL